MISSAFVSRQKQLIENMDALTTELCRLMNVFDIQSRVIVPANQAGRHACLLANVYCSFGVLLTSHLPRLLQQFKNLITEKDLIKEKADTVENIPLIFKPAINNNIKEKAIDLVNRFHTLLDKFESYAGNLYKKDALLGIYDTITQYRISLNKAVVNHFGAPELLPIFVVADYNCLQKKIRESKADLDHLYIVPRTFNTDNSQLSFCATAMATWCKSEKNLTARQLLLLEVPLATLIKQAEELNQTSMAVRSKHDIVIIAAACGYSPYLYKNEKKSTTLTTYGTCSLVASATP